MSAGHPLSRRMAREARLQPLRRTQDRYTDAHGRTWKLTRKGWRKLRECGR